MTDTEPRIERLPTSDGYPHYREVWDARGPRRGRVVVLHGIQSHAGWYRGLGRRLADRGWETHLADRRGSGANEVKRGHASASGRLIADIAELLAHLRAADPDSPIAVAGISWGAKIALNLAAHHPEAVDALALVTPGFHPIIDVGPLAYVGISLCFLLRIPYMFTIPLDDPSLFTALPDGQAFIAADTRSLRKGSAGLLASSLRLDHRAHLAWPKVRQPALLMLAGRDRIMDNAKTRSTFKRIGSTDATVVEYPEASHTLEFEPDPGLYARDLADWLDSRTSPGPRAS